MRPLIRPLLFAVARFGLLLSVLMWMTHAGSPYVWLQWDVPDLPGLPAYTVVLVDSDGLYTRYQHASGGFDSIALSLEEDAVGLGQERITFDAFGVMVADDGQDKVILVRHWLIVTTFALLYAVLRWRYRNREETEQYQ